MSLNKTLDRLFDEIRREARRNPDFADRLDAVLRAHVSRRDVPVEMMEHVASADHNGGADLDVEPPKAADAASPVVEAKAAPPEINPVGLYQREGEDALAAVLEAQDRAALVALVDEHNLDPGGEASALDRDALAAHILAQAKRRAERDSKLFDY